ncbi:MAG: DUF4382 domain-containing protein [Pseudomonadota bacterium]
MKTKTTRLGLATTTVIAAAALVACGGGGGSAGNPAPAPIPSMGTLQAAITDAPACGFDQVNVTVSKVRVHQSAGAGDTEGGWTDITLSPAKKINLLNLTNGVLESLGQTALPAGRYQQVRLVLDANGGSGMANSVVPTGTTTEVTLETPSAINSGIKLNADIEVLAGQQASLVMDFDACKSVVTRGNGKFSLKPVVKVIPSVLNGIAGFVDPSILSSRVMVTAQQNGVIVSSTVPAANGSFLLSRLPVGNYDVVVTGEGRNASVIGAVPVASTTSTTNLSTATAPIVLLTTAVNSISGKVTMTPVSASEAAYVAAKQSFAAGPTVTIRYAAADLASGAYTIANLPVTAPSYAAYSATLPLVFAPATTTTPGTAKYRVDASATGYASKTYATPVDILAGPATAIDFALVP